MSSKSSPKHEVADIEDRIEETTIGTFLQNAFDITGSVPYDNRVKHTNRVVGSVESINSDVVVRKNQFKKRLKRCKSTGALYRSPTRLESDSSESSSSSLESLIRNNITSGKALQPLSVSKAKERFVYHILLPIFG